MTSPRSTADGGWGHNLLSSVASDVLARPPAIQTVGLTKWYGRHLGIADLNLEVPAGEVFGFIGPNGSGKTTTIRLLLDMIRPTSGTARLFGRDAQASPIEVKRRVGYVAGRFPTFERLTPWDLFQWLGRIRGDFDSDTVGDLAERLQLDTTRRIGTLSTGNQQKVSIIQAMMHRPDLLVLDEPTSGLDPIVRRAFGELVHERSSEGATVFLSSHVLAEVEDICHRVGMVVAGRLTRTETVADLRAQARRRVAATLAGVSSIDRALDQLRDVPSVQALRPLSVLSGQHPATEPDGETIAVEIDVVGSMDELIKAVGRFHVVDLTSEPLTLQDVFFATYAENGGQPESTERTEND